MLYSELVENIQFPDFQKINLRVGRVTEASLPEGSEKLIRLVVDFGIDSETSSERRIRTVFTGLKAWYDPDFFIDKHFVFVYNLEPRKMMNEESQGMLLAVHTDDKPLPLEAPNGSVAGQTLT